MLPNVFNSSSINYVINTQMDVYAVRVSPFEGLQKNSEVILLQIEQTFGFLQLDSKVRSEFFPIESFMRTFMKQNYELLLIM